MHFLKNLLQCFIGYLLCFKFNKYICKSTFLFSCLIKRQAASSTTSTDFSLFSSSPRFPSQVYIIYSLYICMYIVAAIKMFIIKLPYLFFINLFSHILHPNHSFHSLFSQSLRPSCLPIHSSSVSLQKRACLPKISAKHNIASCNRTRQLPSY